MPSGKNKVSFYQNDSKKSAPFQLRLIRSLFGTLAKVSPGWAHKIAVKFFFSPRRGKPSADIRPLKKSAHTFYVKVNGKKVTVWSWGNGPAVLMVHGWEGYGLQFRNFIDPLLENGYRVLTFDAPAHGDSGGSQSNLPEFAETIRRIEKTVGHIEAVIGHSMGCAATTLALEEGLSVNAVGLIAGPATIDYIINEYATIFNLPETVIGRLKQTIASLFGRPTTAFAPAAIAPKLSVPAFIIHDRNDAMVNYENAEKLKASWKNARIMLTEGLGHKRILFENYVIEEMIRFIMQPSGFFPKDPAGRFEKVSA